MLSADYLVIGSSSAEVIFKENLRFKDCTIVLEISDKVFIWNSFLSGLCLQYEDLTVCEQVLVQ